MEEITEEVARAVWRLKNGKYTGIDQIQPELKYSDTCKTFQLSSLSRILMFC